ncbi:MAG TPA: GGDEF domain-containing protein [Conexibacter sp.]|jgi:diguanylate cyclase (GGDEF)-like protein
MGVLTRVRRGVLPVEVATLALMNAGAAVVCLLAALFPLSTGAPTTLNLAVAGCAAALAVLMLVLGKRTPSWLIHGDIVIAIAAACAMAGRSSTPAGELLAGFVLTWIGVYVTLFMPQRQARLHALLMTVGLGVAVIASSLPSGLTVWVSVIATVWLVVGVVGHLVERLHAQADTDPLTGVLNRFGFERAARREQAVARREASTVALVLIDLDGFKTVNDRGGHAAGDQLLIDVTKAWAEVLRPRDVLARYGGDELVVLLPRASRDDAERVVRRLARAHDAPWTYGLETWRRDEKLEACLARADHGLYAAKPSRRHLTLAAPVAGRPVAG